MDSEQCQEFEIEHNIGKYILKIPHLYVLLKLTVLHITCSCAVHQSITIAEGEESGYVTWGIVVTLTHTSRKAKGFVIIDDSSTLWE